MDFKNETAPTLAFDLTMQTEQQMPMQTLQNEQVPQKEMTTTKQAEQELTPQEMEQVDAFVKQIDLTNSQAIMNYGVGTQKKMAEFSEKAIDNVRTKDMGEVGDMISTLVTQLKDFDVEEEQKGLRALFKKSANRVTALKAKYSKVETNVVTITDELEKHQIQLMKDVDILDRMYALNLNYYKELTMYIIAGKKKLELLRNSELVRLQQKARLSGLPEDAQAVKDMAAQCDRFEKKIYDLELTRTIAMQTGPQIRMVQSSDTMMAEKIQSTIVNTIPLWKNQMVIAMGIENTAQAEKAQRAVTDMTNEMLRKNADMLHTATVDAAKESERGIVDLDTLKHTNETLISSLDEVMQIQKDGKAKRAEAEVQLAQMENQLKTKLLDMSKQ